MLKLLPAYWMMPIIAGLPSCWVIICKGSFETTAKLTYLGSKFNWIEMMLRQFCQFGFFSCIHYWIYQFIMKSKCFPPLLLNMFFYGIYFEIFGFGLYDFEYTRINMQTVLPSIFTTYVGRFGSDTCVWSKPLWTVPNSEIKIATTNDLISESIKDQPTFWISTIIFISSWIILQIFLIIHYRQLITSSAYFSSKYLKIKRFSLDHLEIQDILYKPSHPYKNIPFILTHILAGIHIILLFITFCIPSDDKIASYSFLPYLETIFLAFSHFENHLESSTKKNLTNIIRDAYLPPGRRWLDNRNDPVYPAVHGDMNAFCAYNSNHEDCKNFVPKLNKKPLVDHLPNVVLILYESLTPSYDILAKEFIKEQAHLKEEDPRRIITDTSYYNKEFMKNLGRYQKYGVTFSGLASHGIPTASGFNGLTTGLLPSQTYNNIIDGSYSHCDDLPSLMQQYGYRSFFICASQFSFDGVGNWVLRKSAHDEALNQLGCEEAFGFLINDTMQKNLIGNKWPKMNPHCDPAEVEKLEKELIKKSKNFPRWFDYAFDYMPSPFNVNSIGIDPKTLRLNASWPSDRISSAIFRSHWKQFNRYFNKNESFSKISEVKKKQPIFGFYLTIEAHVPYRGYDKDVFYDPVNKSRMVNSDYIRDENYRRVNKFSDKYSIGETLDFLKENDPNTIFIITGDHGTRDVPVREPDMPIYDDVIFSSDCVHKSSGTDSFFVVSGVIGYLGDDPIIKAALGLDEFAGKTIKIPTDHSDLIYTVEDIIAKLNGTIVPPTHRRSRNLIDLTRNLTKTIKEKGVKEALKEVDSSGWKSASLSSFNIEYREGTNLLRTHPADEKGSHLYEGANFPVCYRSNTSKPMELGTKKDKNIFKRMFKYVSVTTHLQYKNRLFHYSFRDEECIKNGKCEFQEPGIMKNNDFFFFCCLILVPFITMFFGGLIPEIVIISNSLFFDYEDMNLPTQKSDNFIDIDNDIEDDRIDDSKLSTLSNI